MSDAKARAAARRQAILAAKGDRLAKFTKTTHNDSEVSSMSSSIIDDPPLATIPATSASPAKPVQRDASPGLTRATAPHNASHTPSGTDWDNTFRLALQKQLELASQQQQYGRSGSEPPVLPPLPNLFGDGDLSLNGFDPSKFLPPQQAMESPKPKSLWEKLFPLLHIFSTIAFLLFFVWSTSKTIVDQTRDSAEEDTFWTRWAELGIRRPVLGWEGGSEILYGFVALQIALHSLRIMTQTSGPRLPTIVAMALPHLPPPFPTYIQNGFRWVQIFSLLLDDVAVFVVGLGVVIFVAGYLSP